MNQKQRNVAAKLREEDRMDAKKKEEEKENEEEICSICGREGGCYDRRNPGVWFCGDCLMQTRIAGAHRKRRNK